MRTLRRPVKIMIMVAGAVLLFVLVLVANVARSRSQVRGVEVVIRYGNTPHLVGRQAVVDTVLRRMPNLTQISVKNVDCRRVAAEARRVPYLTNVSASTSVSGKVVIHADQRRPIARLYYGNSEFYLDRDGKLLPPSAEAFCDVVVAGGQFTGPLRADSLNAQTSALWNLSLYLDEHDDYAALVDQIFVLRDGNVVMVPKVGNHIIELGAVADLDSKFSNLLAFYRKGMPLAGWDTYSRISLKFKGQVVGTKRK